MKHTLMFVGLAVSATACNLLPIPGFGGSSARTPTAPSEEVSSGDPKALGTLEAGKSPPWCSGYTPAAADHNVLSIRFPITGDTLGLMALAACDKPGDAERERQVAEWRTTFKQTYAATTDADFVATMTLYMVGQESLREAQCAAVAALDVSEYRRKVIEGVVGCGDLFGLTSTVAELDPATTGTFESLAVLASCIRSENDLSGIGACLHDARSLDRAQFDAELARIKPNLYGRVHATLAFGEVKKNADAVVATIDARAKKDPAWKQLSDAHEAGWAAWTAARAKNEKVFEAVAAFDAKAATGSKKAAAGCSPPLFELYQQHMGTTLKTKEEVIARANDAVGRPLVTALMHCLALEGTPFAYLIGEDLLEQGTDAIWGPRNAALIATARALGEVLKDQPDFELKLASWNFPPRQHDAARRAADRASEGASRSYSGKGEVGKLTPMDNGQVRIDFKKVTWKESIEECTPTNKVKAIDSSGELVYYDHCVVTGSRKKESSLAPIVVPALFAAVIKPGNLVFEYGTMSVEYEQPVVAGFPVEVYANAKSNKLVAYMGVKLAK